MFEDGVVVSFGARREVQEDLESLSLAFPKEFIREREWAILSWLFLGNSEPDSIFFYPPGRNFVSCGFSGDSTHLLKKYLITNKSYSNT
jgi:hypothetical protein